MGELEGRVALVTGLADPGSLAYAVALSLAARGARVIVSGEHERQLGEVVGEVANAGGKARHVAGRADDPAHHAASVARAMEVFGALDLVVACDLRGAGLAVRAAAPHMRPPRRAVVVSAAAEREHAPSVLALATDLGLEAIPVTASGEDADVDRVLRAALG
jgi:hypothetical protein